jgi:hypothetical protein
VDIDELERLLLEVSSRALVVRDLCALLRAWVGLGVRGLPQGVPPSGPLGNLYLRPLDETLASLALPYVRWMDDFVVATPSYHDARRVLDALSNHNQQHPNTQETFVVVRSGALRPPNELCRCPLVLAARRTPAHVQDLQQVYATLDGAGRLAALNIGAIRCV